MTFSAPTTQLRPFKTRNPLFQPDLFQCILDEFTESRSVLVSLARTCRTFSEPSLDRLWSNLYSLEPLIRCYATVLNEETAKTPPSPTEWDVIHRYSYRVKELHINVLGRFSMFFLRATSLHPSLLMPNLRVLRWRPCFFPGDGSTTLSIIFIQRLLSPSLVSLSVTLNDPEDGTPQSFLANYPFLCSNLESISINTDAGKTSRAIIRALSRAVTCHAHLESLHLFTPIDDVALTHFAMSPKLKKVSLMLHPRKSNLPQVRIPSDVIPFRSVEDLLLEIWDFDFVIAILRTQGQMFRLFSLCLHFTPTPGAVLSLLTALTSCQRTRSLRTVRLTPDLSDVEERHSEHVELDEWPSHHPSYQTFRPLASLFHLHTLIIDLGLWFSIDNDELTSLARNWPLLRVLNLRCRQRAHEHPWHRAKYVTFKGLLSLLKCCPCLYDLSLPVDAREVPTDTGDIVCNPALRYLHLPESPIGDRHAVQDFLVRHFPSVVEVWYSFDVEEDAEEVGLYNELWDAVNEYLLELHFPDHDGCNPLDHSYEDI